MSTLGKTLAIASFGVRTALVSSGCAATSGGDVGEVAATDSEESALRVSCTPSSANGAVAAPHRALLDTIAFTEGTSGRGKDGYNVTFAYHTFSSCASHPDLTICSGNFCSTAAGRYQILTKTWNRLGFNGFGPANQDRAGMKLVAMRGANVPTGRPMTATEFSNTMDRISYEWASLPPGRYGQSSYSMATTRAKYCSFAGC